MPFPATAWELLAATNVMKAGQKITFCPWGYHFPVDDSDVFVYKKGLISNKERYVSFTKSELRKYLLSLLAPTGGDYEAKRMLSGKDCNPYLYSTYTIQPSDYEKFGTIAGERSNGYKLVEQWRNVILPHIEDSDKTCDCSAEFSNTLQKIQTLYPPRLTAKLNDDDIMVVDIEPREKLINEVHYYKHPEFLAAFIDQSLTMIVWKKVSVKK